MYVDAESKLKEVAKAAGNQYADKDKQPEEEQHSTITAPLGAEAEMMMMDMGMESDMMISDDEVMLVGDDFVVSETDFNKEKEEDINNVIPVSRKWAVSFVNTVLMSCHSSSIY